MKDMVTNGTGNSRYLKSSVPAGTTWAEVLTMLRDGTFPVDFNGLNPAGITQQGSAYSRANVLPDDVCASLGIDSTTAEPKDAFASVASRPRPNLLKNAYFVGGGSQQGPGYFPINSKGQTSYSQIGNISIDHWFVDVGLTISSNFITIQENTIYQNGETALLPSLMGKSVTASALLSDGTLISGTVVFPTALPQSITGYLFGNSGLECVIFPNGEFQSLRIPAGRYVAAKLELGDTQTLAHQRNGEWVLNEIPDYNEELVRCMDTPSQIETGSYVGTGTYGSSNPNSLTFSFKPKMVFIKDYQSLVYGLFLAIDGLTATYQRQGYNTYDYSITNSAYAKFDGLTLTWYNTGGVSAQMNNQNTYCYTAIG